MKSFIKKILKKLLFKFSPTFRNLKAINESMDFLRKDLTNNMNHLKDSIATLQKDISNTKEAIRVQHQLVESINQSITNAIESNKLSIGDLIEAQLNSIYNLKVEMGLRKPLEKIIQEAEENQKPLISVIIPVYGVEEYLRKCLDSLVNQTLKNIEIIVVNDCSPDNSEDIILEYQKKDSRIVYIKHDVNKGQGGARNTGIKAAKADYLMFIDSDDWYELNACYTALSYMMQDDYDFVQFGYKHIGKDGQILREKTNTFRSCGNKTIMELLQKRIIWQSMCNKICKRSIFIDNNIWQPEKVTAEDVFGICYLMLSKKCLLITDILYNYLKRDNSSDNTISAKVIKDKKSLYSAIKDWMMKYNKINAYERTLCTEFYIHIFHTHYKLESVKNLDERKEFMKLLKESIEDISISGIIAKEKMLQYLDDGQKNRWIKLMSELESY